MDDYEAFETQSTGAGDPEPSQLLADLEECDEENELKLQKLQKELRRLRKAVASTKKVAQKAAAIDGKDKDIEVYRFGENAQIEQQEQDAGSDDDDDGAAAKSKAATVGKASKSSFCWNDGQGGNAQLVVLGLHERMLENTTEEDSDKCHSVYVWTKTVWKKGREVKVGVTTTRAFQDFAVQ